MKYDQPIEVYALQALNYFYEKNRSVFIKSDSPDWVRSLPFFSDSTPEDVAYNLKFIATGSGEKRRGYDQLLGFIKGYAIDDEVEELVEEAEGILRDKEMMEKLEKLKGGKLGVCNQCDIYMVVDLIENKCPECGGVLESKFVEGG